MENNFVAISFYLRYVKRDRSNVSVIYNLRYTRLNKCLLWPKQINVPPEEHGFWQPSQVNEGSSC